MEKLLTIIVAAYNEEKNISKCMDSVLNQTNNNFDLIVVDDGSKDNTLEILKGYLKKFEEKEISLNIITKENGGLSSARNEGVKNVSTKYFSFLDADDTITSDYIQKITDGLIKFEYPDVYKIGLVHLEQNGSEKTRSKKFGFKKTTGEKGFCKMAFSDPLFVLAQLYVIRREYYLKNEFEFTKNIYHEDFDLIPNVIIFAKTFATNNDYVYNYYETEGSITNTTNPEKTMKKAFDIFEIYKKNTKLGKIYINSEKISYETYKHFMQYYAVGLLEKAKEVVSKYELLHENEEIAKKYDNFMEKVYNGCIYTNILLEGYRNSIKRFVLKYFLKYYLKDNKNNKNNKDK